MAKTDIKEGQQSGLYHLVVLSMTIYLYFRKPCIFMTLRLNDIGGVDIMMAPLLAHEFGHLMGSDHDGDKDGAQDFHLLLIMRLHRPYMSWLNSVKIKSEHTQVCNLSFV